MKAIYVGQQPAKRDLKKDSIFLAGPSPRKDNIFSPTGSNPGENIGENWRLEALDVLEQQKFKGIVYVPLLEDGSWHTNFDMQMDWELKYLDYADVIAFWVPRNMQTLPGLTTNIEYGMYVDSGKIVLGYPFNAPHTRYMARLAQMRKVPTAQTLFQTLCLAIDKLKSEE
ncbi:MAG TPA: nucleoside 2-deoxyribosyltransferase domain-containing protein [Candidatus Paceibacterota bacterium]|nr:nucleoside 2-deoxyribosyltransferase domain-containing protein [Candidatus Paceibacterota bacterium]